MSTPFITPLTDTYSDAYQWPLMRQYRSVEHYWLGGLLNAALLRAAN